MARQYGAPKEVPGQQKGPGYTERRDQPPQPKEPDPSPDARTVDLFHKNAGVDTRAEDIHHTLGSGPNNASPGDHNHDGSDSALILDGITITGSKSNFSTVAPSLLAALTRLGAQDSTTA